MAEPVVREAFAKDAAAVASLVNERAVSLGMPADQTGGHVAAWWRGDNVIPLVAEDRGEIAGFGELYVRGDHVRLSVGGRREAEPPLLDALEARAAVLAPLARAELHEDDPVGDTFAARGYRAVHVSYDMDIDLDRPRKAPVWPDGITARRARRGEERTFWRIQEEAFARHRGYTARTFEEWSHLYGEVRPFDPELWLLAEAGAEAVGIAISERGGEGDEETGWIHIVAVRPPWRGRGLGLALLRLSFEALAAAGMRQAGLSVDSESTEGAVRLYERAGMRITHRFQTWEKTL